MLNWHWKYVDTAFDLKETLKWLLVHFYGKLEWCYWEWKLLPKLWNIRTLKMLHYRTKQLQPDVSPSRSVTMHHSNEWWEYPIPPHRKGALLDWDWLLSLIKWLWTKTVNSLSCLRNQFEMICENFVRWSIILLRAVIRRWVDCSHKGMDMVNNNTQVGCGV